MNHSLFFAFGGICMIVIGYRHLTDPDFARRLLVKRNFRRDWEPSPEAERIGVAIIRFILGPILMVLGMAFLFGFIPRHK
jgi:hypothetical protein